VARQAWRRAHPQPHHLLPSTSQLVQRTPDTVRATQVGLLLSPQLVWPTHRQHFRPRLGASPGWGARTNSNPDTEKSGRATRKKKKAQGGRRHNGWVLLTTVELRKRKSQACRVARAPLRSATPAPQCMRRGRSGAGCGRAACCWVRRRLAELRSMRRRNICRHFLQLAGLPRARLRQVLFGERGQVRRRPTAYRPCARRCEQGLA